VTSYSANILSWLHHANVDRQIAMWQAIYPNQWIQPAISSSGTWTIYPNTQVDENTPLTPFTMGDSQTPYTSVTSRFTQNFGYSYPDVPYWLIPDKTALAANVTQRVNLLYNSDGHLGTWPTKRSMRVPVEKRATLRDWSVSVQVPNGAVSEPFSVKFTVGETLVGKMVILSTPSRVERDAGANRITHAEFTLKNVLNGVDSSDVDAVIQHLKGNLNWTVVKNSDGSVVGNVQGLQVEVADEIVQPAHDISKFPSYGDRTVHPEITA
jgi:tyrosinase